MLLLQCRPSSFSRWLAKNKKQSAGPRRFSPDPPTVSRPGPFRSARIMVDSWLQVALVLWLVPGCMRAAARLYTEEDPLLILTSGSLKPTVTNSSSAWLVQFFSSWCGHCIHYSSTWKALAQDVKGARSLRFIVTVVKFASIFVQFILTLCVWRTIQCLLNMLGYVWPALSLF